MQRASRQRIALALIFCLVQSGMLSSAPRSDNADAGTARGPAGSGGSSAARSRAPRSGGRARRAPHRGGAVRVAGRSTTPLAPCDAPANEIVAENCLPGDTDWDITGAGSPNIQGFATDISVNLGQPVAFKIDTPATDYRLDIYRMGYYAGRRRPQGRDDPAVGDAAAERSRRACATRPPASIDCGNWGVSATWTRAARPPSRASISRSSFAKMSARPNRRATSSSSCATTTASPICCSRPPTRPGRRTTRYGGNSLYHRAAPAGPRLQGQLQPAVRHAQPRRAELRVQRRSTRWCGCWSANGYDVSYITGVDTDRIRLRDPRAQGLPVGRPRRVLVGPAARERRSGARRRRASGVLQRQRGVLEDALGEQHRWIRHARTARWSATRRRTPTPRSIRHPTWTGTWRDPRFSPPSDGGRPENALTGTIFKVNGYESRSIARPAGGRPACGSGGTRAPRRSRCRRHADAAARNARVRVGRRPRQRVPPRRSDASFHGHVRRPGRAQRQRFDVRPGNRHAPHDALPHSGAALVFGAGTVQWSWGLDANHDFGGASPTSVRHAAGDRQSARRHGACSPASLHAGLDPRQPVGRHRGARVDDRCPRRRRDAAWQASTPVDDQRHGDRRGGVVAGGRGLGRWRRHVARGDRARELDVRVDAVGRRAHGRSRAAPSTTAATSRRRRPGTSVTVVAAFRLPVQHLGLRRRRRRAEQRRRCERRSSWA